MLQLIDRYFHLVTLVLLLIQLAFDGCLYITIIRALINWTALQHHIGTNICRKLTEFISSSSNFCCSSIFSNPPALVVLQPQCSKYSKGYNKLVNILPFQLIEFILQLIFIMTNLMDFLSNTINALLKMLVVIPFTMETLLRCYSSPFTVVSYPFQTSRQYYKQECGNH